MPIIPASTRIKQWGERRRDLLAFLAAKDLRRSLDTDPASDLFEFYSVTSLVLRRVKCEVGTDD